MPIDVLIEGFLFYKASPQKKQTIQKVFGISSEDFTVALEILKTRLQNGATRIIETEEKIQLVTSAEMAPIIEELRKRDFKTSIGKAGAETLAIILYRGPVTRTEVDRVRGVNSSFIIRNLLTRGLIERNYSKETNSYKYSTSTNLLSHLGVENKHELPNFANINNTLDNLEKNLTEDS